MQRKLIQFLLVLVAVIGLNMAANHFFFRIDLTEEKRFTISDATKNLLGNLEDDVHIKVYPRNLRRI
jgi:ABC-2 type transport system permease protein